MSQMPGLQGLHDKVLPVEVAALGNSLLHNMRQLIQEKLLPFGEWESKLPEIQGMCSSWNPHLVHEEFCGFLLAAAARGIQLLPSKLHWIKL